ncbi:MAG: type II toxin-antitoxin system VapC family toxin [Akkermansiaceae bacterium]|nr:type II toxin-antitoxin system VapC family toxin [Akkermansiaceae bacterium]
MNQHYLLDTCAWLDAFSTPEFLRANVRQLIDRQQVIHIASISLLEVARKEAAGKLHLGVPIADYCRIALPRNRVKILEISPEIAIDSTRLPEWDHKDPGDCLIVATARVHRLTVLTCDAKILAYPHVKSLATRK